ncbi:hypothetical protein GCM10011574_38860 [Microbispora bryophytorum]|uniref:Uncharacterized protein n=1 Tax=Microbispora bryophytorum TaxID=1460882 RepID=A0A8H9H159_9ACTN|nr:hypothetical protein GCM10011574_38860 [Microbispora bryophytorum]
MPGGVGTTARGPYRIRRTGSAVPDPPYRIRPARRPAIPHAIRPAIRPIGSSGTRTPARAGKYHVGNRPQDDHVRRIGKEVAPRLGNAFLRKLSAGDLRLSLSPLRSCCLFFRCTATSGVTKTRTNWHVRVDHGVGIVSKLFGDSIETGRGGEPAFQGMTGSW